MKYKYSRKELVLKLHDKTYFNRPEGEFEKDLLATKEQEECPMKKCIHRPKDESCNYCILNPTPPKPVEEIEIPFNLIATNKIFGMEEVKVTLEFRRWIEEITDAINKINNSNKK